MDDSGAWRGERRGDAKERVVRVKKVRFERRILGDGLVSCWLEGDGVG